MTTGATATVLGGFWPTNSVSSLSSIQGKGFARRKAAQALATKGTLAVRHTARTLDGVAPGATSTKTFARVVAAVELGGVRATEAINLINRATVAGDVTEINADILSVTTRTTFGASPPSNKDGNPLGYR